MRVSLQIDGDASGAKQAAQDASAAVTSLGKSADDASKKIQDGYDNAAGAASKFNDAQQNGAAANDNVAGTVSNVASKVSELANKLLGSQSAAAKAAAGIADVAGKAGEITKAAGFVAGFATAIGAAITVATTLYGIINSGSTAANAALQDQGRLIGIVRDAYKDAAKKAGEFYDQTKNITALQNQQAIIALQAEQQKQAGIIVNKLQPAAPQLAPGAVGAPGLGDEFNNGLTGALFPDQSNEKLTAFQGAFDALKASIAAGNPDIEKFRDTVAGIGIAAASANPALAATAASILKQTQAAGDNALALKKSEAIMAVLNGTASEQQKKLLGVATAATQSTNEYDRMTKALQRQAAATEAEAQTAGQSAGEAARLRTQFILTEAAQQSGIKVAGAYADQIKKISDRAGEAAQKLAQAKLASDTAFNRAQLGRSTVDAAVADQLRGAYGDRADLNSDIANAIRANETLKDLKSTGQDMASGFFRDARNEIQQGVGVWKAFGDAGVNALTKIEDKLADKIIDAEVSQLIKLLGSTSLFSGGPIGPLKADGTFDVGGWTGPGAKYDVAGVVHRDEFVFDKASTNAIGVGNLYTLMRGARGYADGGLVGSPPPWGGLGGSGQSQGGAPGAGSAPWAAAIGAIHNTIDARGADNGVVMRLQRAVAQLNEAQQKQAAAFAGASYQQQFGVRKGN